VWTTPSEGYLPYGWGTLLISQNVNETVALEATATDDSRLSVQVRFRAQIDGKIGFKQLPQIIDPGKNGRVELYLQNLSAQPLKILGVMSYSRAYVVDDSVPTLIESGKSGRILIRYVSQAQVSGAAIGFVFSEDFAGRPITTVPLNVKLPEEKKP